jgi:polar amino acid transport system substrate-binding protein
MTSHAVAAEVRTALAPAGTLRAAINFGNAVLAQKDPATGEARGVSVDIARELASRLGAPLALVTFDAAGKVFEALGSGAWDVAFLAIDPKRAAEIDFTAPYVIIEGSYMVRADSPLRAIEDVDRPGVRIAVGNGSAYELYLSRTIRHAQLVRAATGAESIEQFFRDGLEVAAGVKSPLVRYAQAHAGLRVMDGRFMAIEQAMGAPKGRGAGAAYLRGFVEELKASGFVADALTRHGQHDAKVAPA